MNLEIKSIKDIKDGGLKIPARKMLKELSTLEILYLHFSVVEDSFEDLELMDYKSFVKSLTDNFGKNRIKKMPREELLNDLVEVFDGSISLGKLMAKGNSTYVEKVYTALSGLFLEGYNEEILKTNLDIFKDGLSKSVLKLLVWLNNFNNTNSNEDMNVLIENSKPIISKAYFNMLDSYHYENEELNEKLSNFEAIWEKRLSEKESKISKVKEINKKLNKEVDSLKKSLAKENKSKNENKSVDKDATFIDNNSEIFEIKKMITSLSEQNKKGFEDLLSSKNDVMRASYERQIDKLTGIISDLKANLKIKSKEIKDLENIISSQKTDISKLNRLVDDYNEKAISVLEDAAIGLEDSVDEMKNVDELVETRQRRCSYVGYVEISEGSHYVIDSNDKRNKIVNIKENTYVADGQFVVCTDDHEFIFASPSFIDKNNMLDNVKFGVVVNASPIKIEVDGLVEHNIAYHQGTILKKGQVVAVRNGFLIKAYKTQKLNLDQLLEPIKMTGQDVFFIVNTYGEHLIARDIETNEEIILANNSEDSVRASKKDIVCVKDNKIVNIVNSKYWYTNSQFYSDRIQFGPIEKKDGLVYIRKTNGEFIVVNDISPMMYDKISDGDVIAVDEFDDYLYKVDTESSYIDRVSYSAIRKTASESMTSEKAAYEIKGKVAIIGSYKARDSYIKYFRERGYDVQFIYGYEKNPTRVINKCRDCEAVICDVSHMGHHIQDKIKDRNFTGFSDEVLVGFAETHGASSAFKEFERLKSL